MKLVSEWKTLWKAWSMWAAALGIALPEVLQFLADNTDLVPGLDAGWKSIIRLACLVMVVVLRPVKQANVSGS